MFLHVELELPAGDEGDDPRVDVGLVPLMLPVETGLEAGGAGGGGAGAGVAAATELGPVVGLGGTGAGAVAGASEDKLGATFGGKLKVVVAVGTPLASISTEMMREAVTWTVTSTTTVGTFCLGAKWRTSRLCMRPISGEWPPSLCRLDG